jgi:hypothetical protein
MQSPEKVTAIANGKAAIASILTDSYQSPNPFKAAS